MGGAALGLEGISLRPSYASLLQDFAMGAVGAVGLGFLPEAGSVLAGFGTITGISDIGKLVNDTDALVKHIDTLLNQVSSTLTTIQIFIQDCDKALVDIDNLISQLPNQIGAQIDLVATKKALGRLRGHAAVMGSRLSTRQSIAASQNLIQALCDEMVVDLTTVDALVANDYQFVMQTVPALSTWVQGYVAYNLLLPPLTRSSSPWDHDVVKNVALPRMKSVIQTIKDQRSSLADTSSTVPLTSNVLYTFDGANFHVSKQPFAVTYPGGSIDSAPYYTIWPAGVTWQSAGLGGMPGPRPGQLCYLRDNGPSPRDWLPLSETPLPGWNVQISQSAPAAAIAYNNLLRSTLQETLAFDQLTDGWQIFDQSVKSYLINVDKATWRTIPQLKFT